MSENSVPLEVQERAVKKTGQYTYEFPRPSVTLDNVIIGRADAGDYILTIRRGKDPCKGKMALPGGFLDVETDETLQAGAWRELLEETQLPETELIERLICGPFQIGTWGDMGRDPRGRVVTVAYGCVIEGMLDAVAADDAEPGSALWIPTNELPPDDEFAFDHKEIIEQALQELQMAQWVNQKSAVPAWVTSL